MSSGSEVRFDSVLSRRTAEKRTALFVFPAIVVVVAIIGFAAVAISRMSGLETQARAAQQQVVEANKVVDERDRQLRDARSETAVLASAGQGAAVLSATSKDNAASGVVLDHPGQHALAVYAFNLVPPPEGQQYRLIVTDGNGQESLLGALQPDQRGGSFLLARDVPEGIAKVEVALVAASAVPGTKDAAKPTTDSKSASGATDAKAEPKAAPTERKPVLAGALPRPGEAGVVLADANREQGGNLPRKDASRAARRGQR